MLFLFNFEDIFVLIFLNISNIEVEEDLDIDELKNFNVSIQIYLAFKEEYKKFIIIGVNLNIVKNDSENHFYNEDNLYLESNNIGYNDIIQINCIYNYCIFHLEPKTTNNFFFRTMFRFIKKIYRKEETRYWILIIKTTIYKTFIPSFEHPPIYVKERAILERYQESSYLKYYFEKIKE